MIFSPVEPQQIFIDHMRQHPNVLGFVGVGIGKTAAVLYRLNELFLEAESIGALVIAPLRVINLTWPMEIQNWSNFRWMKFANLRTEIGQRAFLNGTAHVYGINYESIPLLASLVARRRGTVPYDMAIYDESTKAKNPSSKRIRILRDPHKMPRVPRNIALTGTPVPNSHLDLFAQVRLVDGGERLGVKYTDFIREYFITENYAGYPRYIPKPDSPQKIEKKIADITVTLKSSDWLDIPDTVVEDVELSFSPELQKQYRKLEKELVIELRKDKVMNVASAASLVTKLLQFTSGHMYDDERDVHPIHNLKVDALVKIVKQEKQPILVACIFQHEQARIRKQFPQAKFFADATTPAKQQQLLEAWNAGKVPMLVAHPASVGHGLNLQHGGSVMVWMSLTYSREMYEQMIARLARRGQDKVIKVYRLMVPGTVDDAVAEALASKAANEARLISALQMLESYRQN